VNPRFRWTCATFCAPLALLAAGCQPAPEPVPGLTARSTLLPLEGPCPESAVEGVEFGAEVEGLRLRISGPGMETVEADGSVGALSIENIPAGEARQVALFGLDGSGVSTWRGVRNGVSVAADANTEVDVLLARIADLSCPRSPQAERRAFHTATRLLDGRVLLVGGARADADASATCGTGCRSLEATGTAEIYDPTTGTFTATGTLAIPRMFHTATLLDDGRVAIAGGTSEALVVPASATDPFPIKPRLSAVSLIEVFNPDTDGFDASVDDPNGPRLFHAATTTTEGWLLLSGGIPNQKTVNDLDNAVNDTTLCDSGLACVAGPSMNARRAGHTMHLLDDGTVYVWGGSIETGDVGGLPGYKPEVLLGGGDAFAMLNTDGFRSESFNLFFAATTQYLDFRVLKAGGLLRDASGTFRMATVEKNDVVTGPVYVIDTRQGPTGTLSAGPYIDDNVLDALVLSGPSFFGGAAPLPGGSRAVIAGGFADLGMTPSNVLDLYNETPFAVQPLSIGGVPRTLRESRGGLRATAIGDGTVVFTGGETSDGAGGRTPRVTSEIFADPEDPGPAS
jgi:hypothetical protein